MSKYYKAEDVERLIENILNVMTGKEEPMETALCELPTIEVSEDCISREWLEQEIEKFAMSLYKDEDYWKGWNEALEAILAQIELAPSVVPQEKEGEWIRTFDGNEWYWYCSNCKEQWYEEDLWMGGNEFPRYCPNCGAKMKG